MPYAYASSSQKPYHGQRSSASTRHRFRSETIENGCKRKLNVQESTNVLELATFAYPARWEICFSHNDLVWHKNETILKHKSYNVRKIKAKEITDVTRRTGNPLSRQLKPARKNSCVYECVRVAARLGSCLN